MPELNCFRIFHIDLCTRSHQLQIEILIKRAKFKRSHNK